MHVGLVGLGRMGCEHGPPLAAGRPHRGRVRAHGCHGGGARGGRRARRRRHLARGSRRAAARAARAVGDGPGGVGGRHAGRARPAAHERRHRHRRRQLLLPGRHPAGGRPRPGGDPVPRHRHQRGHLGPRARVLPHDRRPRRRRRGRGSPPPFPRARCGPRSADTRACGISLHGRGGVPPLRSRRRRPLREDGPQRDRVRDHGRVRGGAQPPAPRGRGPRRSGGQRRDQPAAQPGGLPVPDGRSARSPSSGAGAA